MSRSRPTPLILCHADARTRARLPLSQRTLSPFSLAFAALEVVLSSTASLLPRNFLLLRVVSNKGSSTGAATQQQGGCNKQRDNNSQNKEQAGIESIGVVSCNHGEEAGLTWQQLVLAQGARGRPHSPS